MKLQVLNSQIDKSVNFVEQQLAGFIESRFVRKCDEYFIAYLSSAHGCHLGCQFCHLTVTNQKQTDQCNLNDFVAQFIQVFKHYRNESIPAKFCHINFMARGEPLANQVILDSGDELLIKLGQVAKDEGLPAKFNISTIMPLTLKKSLVDIFHYMNPTMYYSLYSINPEWRKKWMPGAMEVNSALDLLKDYQDFSKKIVKIHYPFIAGENDSADEIHNICDLLSNKGLRCEFNLVRYNTAGSSQGTESSPEVINRNINILKTCFNSTGKVQIIKRIGPDVFASCGTFISG